MNNEIFNPVNYKNDAAHICEIIEKAIPGFRRNVMFEDDYHTAETVIAEIIVGYNEDQERNDCDQFIYPDTGENALVDDLAKKIIEAIEDSKDGYAKEVYGTWLVWTRDRFPIPQGEWWNEKTYDILYASMFGGFVPQGDEDKQETIDYAINDSDWTEGEIDDHWVTETELREMLGDAFDRAIANANEE